MDADKYGPWAIIAGASEGVGASFAHKLGEAGINVMLVARNKPLLDDVAKSVHARTGVQVRVLALDLTAPDMLESIIGATNGIEIGLVVYNAGASHGAGAFLNATLEDALRLVRLNPIGQVSLTYHFGKKMVERGRGGIILIGSLAGNAGGATVVPYSAAKAFTQIFAEGLWSELTPRGVDVLCVVAGAIETPAKARLGYQDRSDQKVSTPDEVAQQSLDNIANGPVFVPPHLAESFREFCSLPRRQATEAMSGLILGSKEGIDREPSSSPAT